MVATYFRHGAGRSINARNAEYEGRSPLTRAKQKVAADHGCTQVVAAAALELLHDGEWHHVGKYAAATAYYDTEDGRLAGTIAHILACGGVKKFAARREELKAARRWLQPLPGVSRGYPGRFANIAANLRNARAVASEVLGRESTVSYKAIQCGHPDYNKPDHAALWLAYHGFSAENIRQNMEWAKCE